MKFIIGVGNPGSEYRHTRHNVGFLALDALKETLAPKSGWKKDKLLNAEVLRVTEEFFLIKPLTFVNRTGETVLALKKKFGMTGAQSLLVCDDVNLEYGKLRLRQSGSAGGHHGLESVMQALGDGEFPRLRVGVGHASMPKDLTDFVLGRFDSDEVKTLPVILQKIALICACWLDEGSDAALATLGRLQNAKNTTL